MCDVGFDGERCGVWDESLRTARKEHQCGGCEGAILPGQKYVAHRSLYDGYWSGAALCVPCRDARKAFVESHKGLIPHPDALRDTLVECIDWDEESAARWQPVIDAMDARRAASVSRAREGRES